MRLEEATELLRGCVNADDRRWLDLGAGDGLFTRALLGLLPAESQVIAVEKDAGVVAELRSLAASCDGRLTVRHADMCAALEELSAGTVDGCLFANSLHFLQDPTMPLFDAQRVLGPSGRVAVIEYDGRKANRWVPYPIAPGPLRAHAARAGFADCAVLQKVPSRYGGDLYVAVLRKQSGTES